VTAQLSLKPLSCEKTNRIIEKRFECKPLPALFSKYGILACGRINC
jgi:predicted ATPase